MVPPMALGPQSCYPVLDQFLPCDATPSVCLSGPSVTFRYRDYVGWNTLKIISRLNRYVLTLTPTSAIRSKETPLKIECNVWGWSHEHKKLAISETVQDRTKLTMMMMD